MSAYLEDVALIVVLAAILSGPLEHVIRWHRARRLDAAWAEDVVRHLREMREHPAIPDELIPEAMALLAMDAEEVRVDLEEVWSRPCLIDAAHPEMRGEW